MQLAERLFEEDLLPAEEPGFLPALTAVNVTISPPPLPDAFPSILPEVRLYNAEPCNLCTRFMSLPSSSSSTGCSEFG